MAVLRGQMIAAEPSRERLKRLHQLKKKLTQTNASDKQSLRAFLDAAGGVELSELGEAFSHVEATRKSRIADELIDFLVDSDWNRRDSAARILGAMGVQKAIPPLRQVVGRPEGESLARLAALRALNQLGGLGPSEIAMLCLDPSPVIRDEADRLVANRETRKAPTEESVTLSSLLKIKGLPTAVFDNLIERNIILSLSQGGQPLRELADRIGKSSSAIRHHLALLQCMTGSQASLQDGTNPLVASHKKGKTTVYMLTKRGRGLINFVDRAYSNFLKQRLTRLPFEKQA
jgi:hypothetical protein